jgi:hypothetical protein
MAQLANEVLVESVSQAENARLDAAARFSASAARWSVVVPFIPMPDVDVAALAALGGRRANDKHH